MSSDNTNESSNSLVIDTAKSVSSTEKKYIPFDGFVFSEGDSLTIGKLDNEKYSVTFTFQKNKMSKNYTNVDGDEKIYVIPRTTLKLFKGDIANVLNRMVVNSYDDESCLNFLNYKCTFIDNVPTVVDKETNKIIDLSYATVGDNYFSTILRSL